ncbi:MaoC family dehydratase N-terminal domain-containing protein [Fredinandcohnia sp. QZ13]|uniref:MaoC family dehydratase N-terminal domain-containing protein n=1 Tax=Fredinandcohnia sp. QZ13 TaxID=3073144 RepID=UPI0028534CF3|nr:MaoC family dehydratase N-terminal domain-containing protein [Fredinandcohnia sp. QZ13]MDR4886176.1 MaoC family dehydratase N-terminal domain-containing protein [Fredinandcohnia sp. QZ13]
MYKDFIGKQSAKVKNVVERGAVKKFAEAIGDPHPIFMDEEFGKASRYKTNIAPPTFPRVFEFGKIEGFVLPEKGLIHGEQIYNYERPLLVEEEIYCYSKVEKYVEKKGSTGSMGFLTISENGVDLNGDLIFSSKLVVIITEAVRKGMLA